MSAIGFGNAMIRSNQQELAELEAQKIDTIYWQAGELQNKRETRHWKAPPAVCRS